MIAAAVIVLILILGIALVMMFSAPRVLRPMASVRDAFADADFSNMPDARSFTARDGTALTYRAYPGDPARVAVLIHGSSGTSASLHPLAQAIAAKGVTVYALSMRGHDGIGRVGDIDYVDQLDDDVADFMATLGPRAGQTRTLVGFSSGGGFTLRFAGGKHGALFDRLVLIAPQFPHFAPTSRPNAGGWISLAVPRIVVLTLLSRIGIGAFGGLPVIRFAVDPARAAELRQTPFYSYRLLTNFSSGDDYLGDLKRFAGPFSLFAGSDDEIFIAEHYASLVKSVRPDAAVTIVPGLGHMAMTVNPAALAAIADAVAAQPVS
jgi:pimeloyl-ACP methyl ester carboxylesterase